MSSCSLDEVKKDLDDVDYVECLLQRLELLLRCSLGHVRIRLLVVVLILLCEDENERSNKQVVHYYQSDHEVPDFAGCALLVNEIPL